MNHQKIACEVENCFYYEQKKCMANEIMVSKDCDCVNTSCDTNCKTFKLK